jgi:hypothetical protein
MKVFVGFGYNDRDKWIEEQVFPILRAMAFVVVDGKDMHGEILQPGVQSRIEQCDAAIGFFTLREGQAAADFNSHIWVRDEMLYSLGAKKPVIPVREEGVRLPAGLMGDRQYIPLLQNDRLACVVDLVKALGARNIRRLKLEPDDDGLRQSLWRRRNDFLIQYRTQANGIESPFREGRLERVEYAFYLNVSEVPERGLLEVQGILDGAERFNSGWVSADAVPVKIE